MQCSGKMTFFKCVDQFYEPTSICKIKFDSNFEGRFWFFMKNECDDVKGEQQQFYDKVSQNQYKSTLYTCCLADKKI